jgi:hypothetical protein
MRIDLLIIQANCLVVDAGISADKAMCYVLGVDTKGKFENGKNNN